MRTASSTPRRIASRRKVTLTAQEILVDNASYPTPKIEENCHKFRPLGLGYANLGALLMSRGLAYDSDEGRNFAAALTAIMHGEAYKQSAIIARDHGGPFVEYKTNEQPFLRVIGKHRDAAYRIPVEGVPADLIRHAHLVYDEALELGKKHGYRNAQVTVLAPTGTIAFMMDCDTTGVEPDIALIKYKKLVGEGFLKIVNQTVPAALKKLGYTATQVEEILEYVNERETIEGAPHLKVEHLPVFDCAFKPANGVRSIHYMGHVRMMGAIQPFISGAISKTVNMPEAATAEEIEQVYLEGWKQGLKAIAIYRDNSKRSQPLSTGKKDPPMSSTPRPSTKLKKELAKAQKEAALPHRRRLPAERSAVTHRFDIAGHEGYITVGLYPDGQPGEIFLKMAKEGSTVSGLMDSLRHDRLRRVAVRRSAARPGQQVRARPVRAVGLHRQPGDPDRQVDRGLHLPVAGLAVPVDRREGHAGPDRPIGTRRDDGRADHHTAFHPRADLNGVECFDTGPGGTARGLRGGGSSSRLGDPTSRDQGECAGECLGDCAAGVSVRGHSPGRARSRRLQRSRQRARGQWQRQGREQRWQAPAMAAAPSR